MNGLNDNLRFHDDGTEQQTGDISCSALDASPLISIARVVVGYGIGPNHEFTVHSAEELRQACIDGLIAERLAYPNERMRLLLLCVRIGNTNYGPTSPEMWPWDRHGCFLVPMAREFNPAFPNPRDTGSVADPATFNRFWASIGRLSNHAANINAMCGRIADAAAN